MQVPAARPPHTRITNLAQHHAPSPPQPPQPQAAGPAAAPAAAPAASATVAKPCANIADPAPNRAPPPRPSLAATEAAVRVAMQRRLQHAPPAREPPKAQPSQPSKDAPRPLQNGAPAEMDLPGEWPTHLADTFLNSRLLDSRPPIAAVLDRDSRKDYGCGLAIQHKTKKNARFSILQSEHRRSCLDDRAYSNHVCCILSVVCCTADAAAVISVPPTPPTPPLRFGSLPPELIDPVPASVAVTLDTLNGVASSGSKKPEANGISGSNQVPEAASSAATSAASSAQHGEARVPAAVGQLLSRLFGAPASPSKPTSKAAPSQEQEGIALHASEVDAGNVRPLSSLFSAPALPGKDPNAAPSQQQSGTADKPSGKPPPSEAAPSEQQPDVADKPSGAADDGASLPSPPGEQQPWWQQGEISPGPTQIGAQTTRQQRRTLLHSLRTGQHVSPGNLEDHVPSMQFRLRILSDQFAHLHVL